MVEGSPTSTVLKGTATCSDPTLPWWPQARPNRGSLSLSAIVDAAIEIIDEGGESFLTMRRLAERLGSSPMALYWYVASRAELLAVIRDAAIAPVRAAVERSEGWRNALESLGRAIHNEIAVLHPNLLPLVFSSDHVPGPNVLAFLDQALEILFEAGFDETEAAAALRTVVNTATAFRHDVDAAHLRIVASDIPGYESLSRLMNQPQWSSTTERFEIALATIMAGIEATIDGAGPAEAKQ